MKPTNFEVMRRNRPKLEKAHATNHQPPLNPEQIAEIEAHLRRTLANGAALVQAIQREEAEEARRRRPGLLRRWVNYACGLGENA